MNVAMWVVFPLVAVFSVLGGMSAAPSAVTPVDEMAWHVNENPPNPPGYLIKGFAPNYESATRALSEPLIGPASEDTPPDLFVGANKMVAEPIATPLAVLPKLTPALDEAAMRGLVTAAGFADPVAALAVAYCESRWQPGAVGGAGELGLWQIHPIHHEYIRATFGRDVDITDPAVNAWYAAQLSAGGTDWSAWSCQP